MTPRASVRLQFHKGFTFADAEALVPYFHALGVSHLYASPIATARAGSLHGYDVIASTRVNPELGGEDALKRLVEALHKKEIGLIVDIVPNHMAATAENPWWADVLRYGRDSRYARSFDIDWESEDPELRGKVFLPVLGRPLREAKLPPESLVVSIRRQNELLFPRGSTVIKPGDLVTFLVSPVGEQRLRAYLAERVERKEPILLD